MSSLSLSSSNNKLSIRSIIKLFTREAITVVMVWIKGKQLSYSPTLNHIIDQFSMKIFILLSMHIKLNLISISCGEALYKIYQPTSFFSEYLLLPILQFEMLHGLYLCATHTHASLQSTFCLILVSEAHSNHQEMIPHEMMHKSLEKILQTPI